MNKDNHKPFVEIEENGKPTIISYNVPEPSTLNGRTFIQLDFDGVDIFKESLNNFILSNNEVKPARKLFAYNVDQIKESMINGFDSLQIFPNLGIYAGLVRLVHERPVPEDPSKDKYQIVSTLPVSNELANLHPIDVYASLSRGKNLVIFKSKQGLLTYDFIDNYSQRNHDKLLRDDGLFRKRDSKATAVPTIPPKFTIERPFDGESVSGSSSRGAIIYVEGFVINRRPHHPQGKFQEPDKVEVYLDRKLHQAGIQTTPLKERTDFKLELPPVMTSGDYQIFVQAHYPAREGMDDLTYVSDTRITVHVLIDPAPGDLNQPSVKIDSPTNNENIQTTTDETILTLKGTSSDIENGVEVGVSTVLANIGDGYVPATPSAQDNWSQWSFQGTTRRTGQLQLFAKAIDKGGRDKVTDPVTVNIIREPQIEKELQLYLVESYRLSSYLGQYGAGRVVKTFSLLPGEKTKITVKTYTKTRTQATQSSSILDSVTDESTKDFESTLEQEQSDKVNYHQTRSYEINAKAETSIGWAKAKVFKAEVSGGVKGSSTSARETFAKNIMGTVQKHSSKASSKRDVTVNASYERTEETGTEDEIIREIQNINVGRTLNFVFRQMNQEILTILHLVDARLVVWDGDPNPDTSLRKEYSMPELDKLFEEYIKVDEELRKKIKAAIIDQLNYIFDYQGKVVRDFIEEVKLPGNGSYLRINPRTTRFKVKGTGTILDVPGIITSADYNVMRTEGILVEALLGQSNALDSYSSRLQDASAESKELENEQNIVKKEKNKLAVRIVNTNDNKKAELFAKVYPCCKPTIFSLWPPKEDDEKKENGRRDAANIHA